MGPESKKGEKVSESSILEVPGVPENDEKSTFFGNPLREGPRDPSGRPCGGLRSESGCQEAPQGEAFWTRFRLFWGSGFEVDFGSFVS